MITLANYWKQKFLKKEVLVCVSDLKQIKGNSSNQLRKCFKHLPYLLWSFGKRFPNLWGRGYYIGSAGHVSQDAVKRYILEQEGKDVFEYSIFGNPNVKIGKFSLERWIE